MNGDAHRTLAELERLPGAERDRHISEMRLVSLPGNVPPWTPTGTTLRRGEWVSILASGRLVLSAELDLWMAPSFALWGRIGGRGPIFNGTRDTTSIRAERDGALELAIYNGEWASPAGDLATPVEAYAGSGGTIDALVIRWRGDAREGLAALLSLDPAAGDPLVAAELARLRAPIEPPAGWRHLWFLGPTECFRGGEEDGRPVVQVDTANAVGILQKPIDFPLSTATTLAWRWRVDELPAAVAEDSPIAHDYMSLALEFENGQDLTWYWSAALPVGTHYTCPLPTWAARETHWVVRSGADGLGRWHDEKRIVAEDYRAAVGTVPARIVGAWFIAVSIFRHGRGRAAFADIVLRDGDRELRVL